MQNQNQRKIPIGWITNNLAAAREFRWADAEYEKVRKAAAEKPLGDKVRIFREARELRAERYAETCKRYGLENITTGAST